TRGCWTFVAPSTCCRPCHWGARIGTPPGRPAPTERLESLHQGLHQPGANRDKRTPPLTKRRCERGCARDPSESSQVLAPTKENTRRQFLSAGVIQWALQDLNL